jgi:hypothetical protein
MWKNKGGLRYVVTRPKWRLADRERMYARALPAFPTYATMAQRGAWYKQQGRVQNAIYNAPARTITRFMRKNFLRSRAPVRGTAPMRRIRNPYARRINYGNNTRRYDPNRPTFASRRRR